MDVAWKGVEGVPWNEAAQDFELYSSYVADDGPTYPSTRELLCNVLMGVGFGKRLYNCVRLLSVLIQGYVVPNINCKYWDATNNGWVGSMREIPAYQVRIMVILSSKPYGDFGDFPGFRGAPDVSKYRVLADRMITMPPPTFRYAADEGSDVAASGTKKVRMLIPVDAEVMYPESNLEEVTDPLNSRLYIVVRAGSKVASDSHPSKAWYLFQGFASLRWYDVEKYGVV